MMQDQFLAVETSAYDQAMQILDAEPSDRIAVIEIDEKSIDEIGRWPWSRDIYQHLNDLLVNGGAKVITYTVMLSENQVDPGRIYLREIQADIDKLLQENGSASNNTSELARNLAAKISQGLTDLDYDSRLAASFAQGGNVILPLIFETGMPTGRADAELADYLSRSTIAAANNTVGTPAHRLFAPIAPLAEVASSLGHLNQEADAHDGVLRSEILAINYYGKVFPSLALATTAASVNLAPEDLVAGAHSVKIGPREYRTSPFAELRPVFYQGDSNTTAFSVDSFADVFSAKIPASKYRDKVVIIGASAVGIGNRFATPVDPDMPPVMVLANTVSGLLQGDHIERPAWAPMLENAILILIGLYIIFVLPLLSSRRALVTSIVIAVLLMGGGLGAFLGGRLWLQLVTPLLFLLGGHLIITVKQFGVTERLKANSDEASSESNRMLGLAFQSQGQLDIAFEKFRQCPLDDAIMEPLYTLALDFERKRQFNKAAAVYEYVARHDDDYRDLQQRLARSRSLDQSTILSQDAGGGRGAMLIDDEGGMQKPMLGRYVVDKELGHGAMGTVYLGRDPKINRVVAIKTIALGQEFDEDDLATVRDRFFREAETAGRLNHPDIVTVFDAGEEHDLAYIAMEFLRGEELGKYVNSSNLLPVNKTLELMARVAEALAYAHKQEVVHRDIKPANIMFNEETNDLKITDFGIARITNSSRTKTGIVLGTPSYMSPEQLAGHSVTGQSDLFSLAVTLFQLLTGQLPFRADSMATLMFKIANEPHTPLHAVRPELSGALSEIIDTGLQKDPKDRYASGEQMAHDLRECIQHMAA
ncbi:MAG: CHASE2 domain-containing protein [Gammaproteobacteria bacterium]|nr:CHASE2 domain-containing protein [Gammaproteobacteria bacterium]